MKNTKLPIPEEYMVYLDKSERIFTPDGKLQEGIDIRKCVNDLATIQGYLRGVVAGVAIVDLASDWEEAHKNAKEIRVLTERMRWEIKELLSLILDEKPKRDKST